MCWVDTFSGACATETVELVEPWGWFLSSLLNKINLTDNLNNPECLSSGLIRSSASFSGRSPGVCGHVTLKSFTCVRKAASDEQMIHFPTRKSEKRIPHLCEVQHWSDCTKFIFHWCVTPRAEWTTAQRLIENVKPLSSYFSNNAGLLTSLPIKSRMVLRGKVQSLIVCKSERGCVCVCVCVCVSRLR